MTVVYVVGSFRDLETTSSVARTLAGLGLAVTMSEPGDPRGIDGCLARIDAADAVYVVNPRAEVGRSVSVDLGYAIARRKPIYALRPIADPPIAHHVTVIEVEAVSRAVGQPPPSL